MDALKVITEKEHCFRWSKQATLNNSCECGNFFSANIDSVGSLAQSSLSDNREIQSVGATLKLIVLPALDSKGK